MDTNDLMELKNSEKIQAVINTLRLLEMPTSFENVNRMTGIYQLLISVRDELLEAEEEKHDRKDKVK